MEEEVRKREKALKEKEKAKKQIPLRLASSLYDEIAAWAEEDFRSVNSQIEYLLAECVKHKKGSR
ncbi:MAG: Arc family DNA-binding protein [Lachnospiraceae bacterium]|nr:Arc family DNA-binding protein [Lachnospiraceae bacterium]